MVPYLIPHFKELSEGHQRKYFKLQEKFKRRICGYLECDVPIKDVEADIDLFLRLSYINRPFWA